MRCLITFSYDGTLFYGYAKQPGKRTVQKELEDALTTINGNTKVDVFASGRTDAGVHALSQKAHFDIDSKMDLDKLLNSLNKLLPADMVVSKLERVRDDFHARFMANGKEYIYRINIGPYNPLERNYVYQFPYKLDIIAMERAIKYFEGTHNFKSFTKSDEDKDDYVRTISQAVLTRDSKNVNNIILTFIGDGFLRYMVRNIVGILIEVGEGKRKPEDIIEIIKEEDRTKAGITAPACGLYLRNVFY